MEARNPATKQGKDKLPNPCHHLEQMIVDTRTVRIMVSDFQTGNQPRLCRGSFWRVPPYLFL